MKAIGAAASGGHEAENQSGKEIQYIHSERTIKPSSSAVIWLLMPGDNGSNFGK